MRMFIVKTSRIEEKQKCRHKLKKQRELQGMKMTKKSFLPKFATTRSARQI